MLDGWYPKVRIGKRRVRVVPVLVTLGVRADGDRVILDVRLVGDESTAAWRDVIHSLVARQIGVPTLAVIDGNPGLAAALREKWLTLAIQRCTTHKLRNLEAKAPARLREELAEEYRRMIYADSRTAVDQARGRFLKKWRLRCPAVVECLDEAGEDLFHFSALPALAMEGLAHDQCARADQRGIPAAHQDARSLPGQDAVLFLLVGLLRTGQVKLRKMDGWQEMAAMKRVA